MSGAWTLRNAISCRQWSLTLCLLLSLVILTSPATAQTFTVIHDFTGGQDGAVPMAGLVIDSGGRLYGTALACGRGSCSPHNGCGTVFQLKHSGSGWVFTPIYAFRGGNDGAEPYGRVKIGPNGTLYGTTTGGGSTACAGGCGTVFNLQPPATACTTALCSWDETVLYRFAGSPDGFYPTGDLTFDTAGNFYGTTTQGGSVGPGTAYKMTHSSGWTESVIYSLQGQSDGGNPYSGVIFNAAGDLFGTSIQGGINNNGAVFELTPSGSGWTENTVYDFQGGSNGGGPYPGVVMDNSGNLYGATIQFGANDAGLAYELTPSGGTWTFSLLYNFIGGPASGPFATLAMDAAGNLYGTTQGDPSSGNYGTVFKLSRSGSGWTENVLHQFNNSDGANPFSTPIFDAGGNLWGTTSAGGAFGFGNVWEITP